MTDTSEIMKKCQIGTCNFDDANNLHAECYGELGRLINTVKKLEADLAGYILTHRSDSEHIAIIEKDAIRYRWLRDNKHLDQWWSVQGPKDKSDNIDADIDAAMLEE
jgi:hypothetical protein